MITTFESIQIHHGVREDVDFKHLTERIEMTIPVRLSNHQRTVSESSAFKWAQRGWSAATFVNDTRSKTSVERVSMLVFDIDSKETVYLIKDAINALRDYTCFVHTTSSHIEYLPRFRLILKLSRDVTPTEYARLWSKFAMKLSAGGVKPDAAVRDPGKFWFCYTPIEDRGHATYRQQGISIDPDQFCYKT
jgi:hypothetical protein